MSARETTAPAVTRTTMRLADGRTLRYYDETPDAPRVLTDPRQLDPVATDSELRYDALRGESVIVASHRQSRTFMPATDACPLCPSRDGRQTEIPSPDYDVVVFDNRFPALAGDPGPGDAAEQLFGCRPGGGRCEVVCFTADHDASFAALTPRRVRTVLTAWTERSVELAAVPGVEQVFCFENRGREIGVTLQHPHGQIYAYPFVTPRTRRMLATSAEHLARTGRNLADDLLAAELAAGVRVVTENRSWVAFVPFAAHWPYEVHLYPRRRVPRLADLDEAQQEDFGPLYLDVLRRFDRLFDEPAPYIAGWHQAPVRQGEELLALHLELFTIRRAPDRLKYLAGSESGMDVFANDVAPEAAAARLRDRA